MSLVTLIGNIILGYKDIRVSYNHALYNSIIITDKLDIKQQYVNHMGNKVNSLSIITRKTRIGWKDRGKSERLVLKRDRKLYKRTLVQRLYHVVKIAKVFVNITTNNTHITVTTLDNNFIKRSIICSAGYLLGIKGTKRSSPLATEIVVKRALYRLKKRNKQARILHLYISGVGRGRSVVRKALIGSRLKIHMIREITAIPHNGTRKPSRRRV